MTTGSTYPKRLIEVDLPIKRISAHARREKSIRHGHISTLHIWWARRPLAACRAVVCAALWPDPADALCPPEFRAAAAAALAHFAEQVRTDAALAQLCTPESFSRWKRTNEHTWRADDPSTWFDLQRALLNFIADFANWDASTVPAYLEASRALTQAAHESLGGIPGTRPLVVDPFAGGGAIPLEALRVGADAFASDLNPVAVLLNKVVLEYIPCYGQRLADEVRKWGQWVKEQAEQELAEFYPKDPDGATPIAYLWARTITCEGPGCGAEVPLIRSLWLAKKGERSMALRLLPNPAERRVDFEIIQRAKAKDVGNGTVARGSATCPCCGYTTPVAAVRKQLKPRRGGAADARLFCVVTTRPSEQGRSYRLPTERDLAVVRAAVVELERRKAIYTGELSLITDEEIDVRGIRHTWAMIYGMEHWSDFFTPRQALALSTYARLVQLVNTKETLESGLELAVQTILGLSVSRYSDICNANCRWESTKTQVRNLFTRQAVPMLWDFAEPQIFSDAAGNLEVTLGTMIEVIEKQCVVQNIGQIEISSATNHLLPNDSVNAFITDPPYYDAVPYSYLSDFFYVWLRRTLLSKYPDLFRASLVPKDEEIIVDRPHELSPSTKDIAFYERELTKAFAEGRRITQPGGIGTIVFASKTTASWEAILQAVIEAGWIVTGSWPIDTEMETRVAAQGQARLGSSIHLVCRPREDADGRLIENIGDWRDVLQELPQRIRAWLPRLAAEGVVGADAIFACLGPALEIFSRYSQVEKANGDVVTLRKYLEHVWAVVSQEALSTIFEGADASGFEPDARLTAIWFWVLKAATNGENPVDNEVDTTDDEDDDNSASSNGKKTAGYAMEYDAVRKLAQGLGAELNHLSKPGGIISIKGPTASINTIRSREQYLFGGQLSFLEEAGVSANSRRQYRRSDSTVTLHSPQHRQTSLFDERSATVSDPAQPFLPSFEPPADDRSVLSRVVDGGNTMLDRLHQAMLLFGGGQSALLGIFFEKTGIGQDNRFWLLAQALSALYPAGSEEKRWVDGVLARKKGLGF